VTFYETTKPYNDRSSFKAILRLNPVGYLFYMTAPEQQAPFCFQLCQEEQVFRLASADSPERERFATVLLKMGLRLATGPGGQEESTNFVRLMTALPQLSQITVLARLPTLMQTVCVECDQRHAVLRCEQCDDLYCKICFDNLHKCGKRATHTIQSLEGKKTDNHEKSLVELYVEKLPFVIGDVVEHISTVAEVEGYKPDASPRKSADSQIPVLERMSLGTMEGIEGVLDTGDPRRGLGRSVATRQLHHQGKAKKTETWVKVAPLGIKLTDEEQKEFREGMAETLREAEDEFAQLVTQFRECCEIKDRTYLFKTYPNCFVGKHTVDALLKKGIVASRTEAVALGNTLLKDDVIQHVSKEHSFEDAGLFYRFADAPLQRDSELLMPKDDESRSSTRKLRESKDAEPEKEPVKAEKEVFAIGDVVELFGLDTKIFNGQRGTIITDCGSSRYEVQLDSGDIQKFRMLNLSRVSGGEGGMKKSTSSAGMKTSTSGLSLTPATSQSFKGKAGN